MRSFFSQGCFARIASNQNLGIGNHGGDRLNFVRDKGSLGIINSHYQRWSCATLRSARAQSIDAGTGCVRDAESVDQISPPVEQRVEGQRVQRAMGNYDEMSHLQEAAQWRKDFFIQPAQMSPSSSQ